MFQRLQKKSSGLQAGAVSEESIQQQLQKVVRFTSLQDSGESVPEFLGTSEVITAAEIWSILEGLLFPPFSVCALVQLFYLQLIQSPTLPVSL
jgi:hypothetical protein